MTNAADLIPAALQTRVQATVLHNLLKLPRPALRLIAGDPIRIDGQELCLEVQAVLRLQGLVGHGRMAADTPQRARKAMAHGIDVIQRQPVTGVAVTPHNVPTRNGELKGRLYRPETRSETSPLMVYYHGGGWVVGDLDTHDDVCRFLAKHADIRVLAVDYRLAPEHPFPAATEDAVDTYAYAVEHAEEMGSSADSLVVGGDSAGGNLAALVAQYATGNGLKSPILQLLVYPAVDASTRRRSRELFGEGFLLTDGDMDWFMNQYHPETHGRVDPRLSPLYADDMTGLPPALVITAGFDPLRDEGEEYARRLSEANVAVISRRFPDLMHGFANLFGVGGRLEQAMFEIVGMLRAGLSLHT